MRYVIAHGHMFKNAGTSFDSALRSAFGEEGFLDHRDDESMRKGGVAYLNKFLSANSQIKAISSHHLCSPLPAEAEVSYLPVYFLRDPIERVVSVYNFERKQPISSLGSKMAKELGLLDYVRWRLQPDVPPTIRNFQTLFIGESREWKRGVEAGQGSLDVAMGVLQSERTAFGLVDAFPESFDRIMSQLARYFPGVQFTYQTRNVSSDLDAEEKKQQSYKLLEPVMGELIQENIYDIALYEFAKSYFFLAGEFSGNGNIGSVVGS
ncbi:sulfotransferase family 2 domain-containing protein [Microbulbifer sp. SAOS-129_SWC]|uniref:sulfotransferase family 2 domain-containing protein n=1 Tax=Microbulbifer sp. SAOS-129_SWC TaxID=3145235 RepID=UPI003217FF59